MAARPRLRRRLTRPDAWPPVRADGIVAGAADGIEAGAADGIVAGAADGIVPGAADGIVPGAADGICARQHISAAGFTTFSARYGNR